MIRHGPQEVRDLKVWAARASVGLVLFSNLQCATAFLATPQAHLLGFEVQGVGGQVMVRGLGLLFLMWCVPYAMALWHPRRHRLSVWEATCMQAVALLGEIALLWTLPAGHAALRMTATRFICSDGGGLLLLLVALRLSVPRQTPPC